MSTLVRIKSNKYLPQETWCTGSRTLLHLSMATGDMAAAAVSGCASYTQHITAIVVLLLVDYASLQTRRLPIRDRPSNRKPDVDF